MKKLFLFISALVINVSVFAAGHIATTTHVNATCSGLCNGTANGFATGGVGPYAYSWAGPSSYTSSLQNITGLCAGTYTLTVIDSSDMSTATATAIITQPSPLVATAVGGGPVCAGSCITINAFASGGTGPYAYSWSPVSGLSSTTISNPTACPVATTTYTVTAVDFNGCTATYAITITVNPLPVVTVNSPTICAGGTAILTVSGATTYNWSTGAITNPYSVSPPTTTSYTVTGTTGGCSATAVATVTVNSSPIVTLTPMPATCGACNGYINTSATGGTTFSWSGPAGYMATTINPTGLCPGTYTCNATYAGCASTTTTNVGVVAPPIVSATSTNTTCGMCNGSVSGTVTGGTPPYTYLWTPFAGTAPTFSSLCAGTYTVTVTDNNGCTANASATVNNVGGPTVTTTVTNASCGACDGSATATPTGGTAPYAYSWVPGGATGASAATLCAASYTVLVTDAMGCTDAAVAIVNNGTGPAAAAITTVNSNCAAATGEIHIGTITGGVAPYTYALDASTFTATTDYYGLSVGAYNVTIKDVNGCIYTQSVIINYLNPPVIALDSINGISCTSGTTGNIFVSITSGTPGYTYLWSNGATTQDLTNIYTYGNYTLTVSDAGGCIASHVYYISSLTTVWGTVTSTPVNCLTLGTATAVGAGGVGPYTYSWNSVPVQTTATAAGLAAGVYNCTITDVGGCSSNVYAYIPNLGCSNVIKGRVYNDANSNCIQDAGELGMAGKVVVANPGSHYAYTDALGNYTIITPNMNNTVSVVVGVPYSATCPATGSLTVNFSTPGDTLLNNDFGYYANPSYFDLGIHPGWTIGSPGFTKTYWIYNANNSPTPEDVLVRFVYDSSLVYTGCTLGGVHTPAQHKIEWTFTGMPAYSAWSPSYKPYAYFNIPTTLTSSSILCSYFEILPIAGDINPLDNTLSACEPITSCHDPNSKSVIPKGQGPNGNIFTTDSVLFYTIHFQNNGNDTAHFVIVRDTLSQYLDAATIIPGASDHPYTFDLTDQGVATFTFNNIMLPDSTTNEAASSGYLNYTIKQKANNPVGTVINNTAAIYFDYNEGVFTNTTVNTIIDITTGIQTQSISGAVKVYPNPFSETTTFVIQSEKINQNYSFELTDLLGKTVRSITGISSKQFEISRNGLQNGIYFYKIYGAESVVGIGKLVIK